MIISFVKNLLKIPIQIRCSWPQTCSISSVLTFEVKYPWKCLGKVTVISASNRSNCIALILNFLDV